MALAEDREGPWGAGWALPTGQSQLLGRAGKAWSSPSAPSRRTTKGRACPAVCVLSPGHSGVPCHPPPAPTTERVCVTWGPRGCADQSPSPLQRHCEIRDTGQIRQLVGEHFSFSVRGGLVYLRKKEKAASTRNQMHHLSRSSLGK